jgi:hypothetical protein
MTSTLKALAIAALMGAVSAPTFAAAHMNSSMTCAEYKALSPEDQISVATMAIAEINDGANGTSVETDARASNTTTGVTAAEATDGTAVAGSVIAGEAKAVEPTGGNTDEANMTAEPMDEAALEAFMVVCDQNLAATVGEAAAGLPGSK